MRQGSQRKGEFVGILTFAQKFDDEISAANVVHQIAEFLVAEWVITKVLDYGAAVRVRVGFPDLIVCEAGISHQQQRPNLVDPEQIDNFFVCQD